MSDPKRARCYEKTPDGKNAWTYARKDSTDIGALFRRIRKQLDKDAEAAKAIQTAANVKPLKAPVPIKRKEA